MVMGMILAFIFAGNGYAQNNSNSRFALANRLMQQEQYQQAYHILAKLYKQKPDSYPIYARTVECLIRLKMYDQAIKITKKRLDENNRNLITGVRLGELYQMKGDTAQADIIWQKTLDANKNSPQAYRYLAQTEQKYQHYQKAAEIYEQARRQLKNPHLFLFESADNQAMAAHYDKAAGLFVKILESDPKQATAVQQRIMQEDASGLYDAMIIALQDAVHHHKFGNRQVQIQRLLIWLYTEQQLYHKAINTATRLEEALNGKGYPVFDLGKRLASLNKFRLADQAFSWYEKHPGSPLAGEALEQRAHLYTQWAGYLEGYHLAPGNRIDSLYRKSWQLLVQLSQKYPARADQADLLVFESELALDRIHNDTTAKKNLPLLQHAARNNHDRARLEYLRGRIQLFQGDFPHARISFTRSNKLAGNSTLSEKTRYYLCLTDFYSGDYDFAKIQMHALEEDHSSYYANDALKLRIYIQNGTIRDSVTTPLRRFSKALFLIDTGKDAIAVDSLLPVVTSYQRFELKDDMVLLIAKAWRDAHPDLAYLLVDRYLRNNSAGRLAERLYWERAQLAQMLYRDHRSFDPADFQKISKDRGWPPAIRTYIAGNATPRIKKAATKAGVIKTYEDLLMHYPRAFYAAYAREQIRQLQAEGSAS